MVKRLAFECELQGDMPRADALHQKLLSLPKHIHSKGAYVDYAKFLCRARCNSAGADQAMRTGLAVGDGLDKASVDELEHASFLVMDQGYDGGQTANDALSLLALAASRPDSDPRRSHFLYFLHHVLAGDMRRAQQYLKIAMWSAEQFQSLGPFAPGHANRCQIGS